MHCIAVIVHFTVAQWYYLLLCTVELFMVEIGLQIMLDKKNLLLITVMIIHTFLFCHKVVISEAVFSIGFLHVYSTVFCSL